MQEYNFVPDPEDRILPDSWYEQLVDPPEPPPKEDIIVVVDLTDYKPVPSEVSLFTSYSLLFTSEKVSI